MAQSSNGMGLNEVMTMKELTIYRLFFTESDCYRAGVKRNRTEHQSGWRR